MIGAVALFRVRGVPIRLHASWLVERNGLGWAVVLDGGRLVGYLSVKDVLHVIALDGHDRWAPAPATQPPRARRE
jgi:hypothetical protein